MAIEVYRPRQGMYARIGTGVAVIVLAIFAAYRFYHLLPVEKTFAVMGLKQPVASLWAGGFFVIEAAIIVYFLTGPNLGGAFLRKKARKFIDLLVDTQSELEKVVWPSREDLVNSTIIVIATIVMLGFFILMADWMVSRLLIVFKVLPK